MVKRNRVAVVVFAVLFAVGVLYEWYYQTVAVKELIIRYDYFHLYLRLYLMRPVLYTAGAALMMTVLQQTKILAVKQEAQKICLASAVLCAALYYVICLAPMVASAFGANLLFRPALFFLEHTEWFALVGLLLSAGVWREKQSGAPAVERDGET